ncbi:hypothetical protein S7711_08985 [Stachybotrys chartarum IBT 7711]|uniref:Uncharacterized protein n=1 Tax=Stachybotrys chartarum (strain CBS 109288 / IBT 7711) TaxID=1280523 RepID=A0A084AX15_STACB|nr:hypothetical protein S7711_08985 [Stachybotrys chartarum IBT 7711]KFA47640.1 hypothetical protein S40293_07666 [Stachybotrys chartarum IBT 40293]
MSSALVTSNRVGLVAAASIVSYGVKVGIDMANQHRSARLQASEDEEIARRKRNEMLMDEYGDRSSLAELERAVQFYEKK